MPILRGYRGPEVRKDCSLPSGVLGGTSVTAIPCHLWGASSRSPQNIKICSYSSHLCKRHSIWIWPMGSSHMLVWVCVRMRVCAGMMCEGGYVYVRYSTGGEKTTFGSQFPLSFHAGAQGSNSDLQACMANTFPTECWALSCPSKIFGLRAIPRAMEMLYK